jgi:hypothetical protein
MTPEVVWVRARWWIGTVGAVGTVVGFRRFRRWHLQWGATDDEAVRPMPGDELVGDPHFAPTRAITIDAPAEAVWPWLVQIGYGRAGFYSYDLLDNLGRGASADRIDPALQSLAVGDLIPMAPGVNEETAFRVVEMHEPTSMVWSKPSSSWAWALERQPGDRTRLIARIRMRYRWTRPNVMADLVLMELGDFWMMRKELVSIRGRAERDAVTTATAVEGGGV